MKKIFIATIVGIGIAGLVFATHFNPKSQASASTATVASTPAPSEDGSSATPVSTTPTSSSTPPSSNALKNGSFNGSQVDVGYGVVQVEAIITGGKLTDVKYLSLPSGGHSSMVSSIAGPQLRSEALNAQSANVNIVSGATSTSEGFQMSLQSALKQAI